MFKVLHLNNVELSNKFTQLLKLLRKVGSNLEVLDMGNNSFDFDSYMELIDVIVKMPRLKMLVTLDLFTFANYQQIANKLSNMKSFISWRINFSSDYYAESVKIKNKNKFRRFKQEYIKHLENKFDSNVRITINNPDLSSIINHII